MRSTNAAAHNAAPIKNRSKCTQNAFKRAPQNSSAHTYSRSLCAPHALHIWGIFTEQNRTGPNAPQKNATRKSRVFKAFRRFSQSGRPDLNRRPLRPEGNGQFSSTLDITAFMKIANFERSRFVPLFKLDRFYRVILDHVWSAILLVDEMNMHRS